MTNQQPRAKRGVDFRKSQSGHNKLSPLSLVMCRESTKIYPSYLKISLWCSFYAANEALLCIREFKRFWPFLGPKFNFNRTFNIVIFVAGFLLDAVKISGPGTLTL